MCENEKIELSIDDISEDGVDFENLTPEIVSDDIEKEFMEHVESEDIVSEDSVKIYLQQIGKIPLLSKEEELEVARKIKENKSELAQKILINANLRLVVSIAKNILVVVCLFLI